MTSLMFLFVCLTSQAQIRANQTLEISIQGVPASEQARLNSTYQVSSSGYITMWQIGQIRAAGKTQTQLASSIASAYRARQIYVSPTFQVIVPNDRGIVQKTFTVGGQVKSTGPKPYRDGLTLFEAVQAAGGETPFGAINRVKLFRNGKIYEYNLKNDRHKGVRIYSGDTVEVPQKNWRGQ